MSDDIDKAIGKILGSMRAASDQATEATKEIAGMVATFNAGLVAGGFSRDEALLLTNTYLQSIFALIAGHESE